jgi:hypothetical protein
MRGNAQREQSTPRDNGATDAFHQLIELQKQIVELVEKNSEAERRCRLLREELAREAEDLFMRSRSPRRRLWRGLTLLWKRLVALCAGRVAPDAPRPDLSLLPDPARHAQSH